MLSGHFLNFSERDIRILQERNKIGEKGNMINTLENIWDPRWMTKCLEKTDQLLFLTCDIGY